MDIAGAGLYLISMLFGLYVTILMLRFLLRVSGANYYNPLAQIIVKLTDPLVLPLSKLLPAVRGIDFAALGVALIIQTIGVMLVRVIDGLPFFHVIYIAWSLLGLFSLVLNIYLFAIVVMVIASWIAPDRGHPALTLAVQITEPVCAPVRRLLPPMGGIDFSPMLVVITIVLLEDYLLIPLIAGMIGLQPGYVFGI